MHATAWGWLGAALVVAVLLVATSPVVAAYFAGAGVSAAVGARLVRRMLLPVSA